MDAGCIAEIANMLRQNTTEQRKPKVGAHRLGASDPIVARRTFHCLVALVDDHGNGVAVVRRDRLACRIVTIVGIIRTGRKADGINAKEIERRFDTTGIICEILCAFLCNSFTVLKDRQRPQ